MFYLLLLIFYSIYLLEGILLFSHSVISNSLQPHELQHAKTSMSFTIYMQWLKEMN